MSVTAEAPPQAEPSVAGEGGLDAFVSYAHKDAAFVVALKEALEHLGRNVWIDADDISPGAPWRRELGSGIEAADSFIFVITPDSLASPECRKELDRAVELGKRMVPVLLHDADGIPTELADVQFIDARNGADLERSLQSIVRALDTDHDWVRSHTQWLARALRWEEHGRQKGYLLRRGGDLQAAEEWLAGQAGKKPPPTPLQTAYIVASREHEKRRLQVLLASALVAVAVALGLAIFALIQRSEAIAQRDEALSRGLAANALSQLSVDPELSILLALEAARVRETPEMRDALRRAVLESHVRRALHGHTGSVSSVAFSRDGSLLATAARDGTARLWETKRGDLIGVLRGHEGPVRSVAFGPSDQLLLTASEDGTARLWQVESRREVAVLAGHEGSVWTAAFSRDGERVVTAGEDGTARVFEAEGGETITVLRGHQGGVASAVFSPDGRTVLTAGSDATVRLWDVETGEDARLGEHAQPVFSAAFDARGKRVLTVAADFASVWDVSSGERLATLGQAFEVFEARFSPDGERVLTATNDGAARIWRADTGAEVADLRASHGGPILDAAWSRDGALVVTAGLDKAARVWDPATGDVVAVLRGHIGSVNAAIFDPTGHVVATGSGDRTVRLWDIPASVVLRGHGAFDVPVEERTADVTSVDFSPDGELVLTAASDATARVWDARSGEEVIEPPGCEPVSTVFSCLAVGVALGHRNLLTDAEFGPRGETVLTAGEDGTAQVWEAASGENVARFEGHQGQVWSASFSPNGERVVTTGQDGTARIWSVATGGQLALLRGHRGAVADAVFDPIGTTVLTAGADKTLRLWDAEQGTPRRTLARGLGGGIAFSPDGSLVVAPTDQDAKLIDVETGEVVALLRGHSGLVTSGSFSPDGEFVVTASQDRTARIWEVAGGTEVEVLRGHARALTAAVFSADGSRVATAAEDGTARVYVCEVCRPVDQLLDSARRGLTRGFTPDERRRFLER
jgi:WD40 repeat protein